MAVRYNQRVYYGNVTFAPYESSARSVSSGHSNSLSRLQVYLETTLENDYNYVAGIYYLSIDTFDGTQIRKVVDYQTHR